MHRSSRLALVSLLLAGLAVFTPAPSASADSKCAAGAMEYVTPVTFHVEMGKFKKSYKVGDTVKVDVKVTRPAEQDPAGLGVSFERPVTQPAADVNVGVGISVGRVFLPGYGRTNAQGKTTVAVKLERYVKPAPAHARAFAYKEALVTTCLTVEEQGYADIQNAFKVKR